MTRTESSVVAGVGGYSLLRYRSDFECHEVGGETYTEERKPILQKDTSSPIQDTDLKLVVQYQAVDLRL
jgi:hypothetical protein